MRRTPRTATGPRASRVATWGAYAAARGPQWCVLGLVALTLAASVTVSLGVHRPWTTLPLALVIGWALARVVGPEADPADTPVRTAGAVALAAVAAWIVVSIALSGEYLIVTRDPGFLTLSGWWLIDHPHTDIPALGAVQAAATQANIIPDAWEAWNLRGDVVQPQGAKALPAVLSVAGWVAGPAGVLAGNAVIGGVGLWAMYALAARTMGPRAALVPTALLGLTVAHQGLSRSAYTEPLTLVLTLAAAAWALRGIGERRAGPLVAAAVVSGAVGFVRIDGAAVAIGALAGIAAAALFARRVTAATLVWVAVTQATVVALGYAALWRWSEAYIDRLADQARSLALAYAAAVVAAVIIATVAAWRDRRPPREVPASRGHRWALAASVTAMVAVVGLASRPLWLTQRRGTESASDQFTNSTVGAFQQLEGYPVDPTRTYGEHTVTWLSYYLGWPLLALTVVGLGVVVWRAATLRPGWWAVVCTLGAPALLYLLRPSIVPDQLWAIRRLAPTAMPLFILAAAIGAWWLAGQLMASLAPDVHARVKGTAAAVLAVSVLGTWVSVDLDDDDPVLLAAYLYAREQAGARDQLAALCEVVDGRPVVLAGSASHFGSLRVTCDVPVVLALVEPDPAALVEMSDIWGEQPVVVTRNPEWFWEVQPVPVVTSETTQGEYALQHMPRRVAPTEWYWFAGVVEADGTVSALSAP